MRSIHWKVAAYMTIVGVILCAATYAEKDKDITLPDAVAVAVKVLFPQAQVKEAKLDEEGLKVYEVELEENGEGVAEVTVAPDGTIIEVETEVGAGDLPQAVRDAVSKAMEGTEIKEAEKEVTYAVVKLVPLSRSRTSYEVELVKDGKEWEIEVAGDGTILGGPELKLTKPLCRQKKHDDDDKKIEWSFDSEKSGLVPEGWRIAETAGRGKTATWEVIRDDSSPSKDKAVAVTKTENDGHTFNLLIAKYTRYKDL